MVSCQNFPPKRLTNPVFEDPEPPESPAEGAANGWEGLEFFWDAFEISTVAFGLSNIAGWNITIFNGKYIFKGFIFRSQLCWLLVY